MVAKSFARLSVLSLAASIAAIVIALTLGAGSAWAGTSEYSSLVTDHAKHTTFKVLYHKGAVGAQSNEYEFYEERGKVIKNLKTSNKKVAKVKYYDSRHAFKVTIKKAGTAKVTFKYRGKKYCFKFVAKTYTNPFKTLTIGSTSYRSLFKYTDDGFMEANLSGALKAKASKYWTIKWIEVAFENGATQRVGNGDYLSGDIECLTFKLKNKKTGYVTYRPFRPEGW
ncbi:MAG: hypothetical protein Q4D27_07075 [Coriobacteriia bacterium]|nr:hypothetical protein [Coriobacteriia bacterium]